MITKIIDATTASQTVNLTPRETQDHIFIVKGHEDVAFNLPTANHFPRTTKPFTILREKPQCTISLTSPDTNFKNQFGIALRTVTLDIYASRTFQLVRESNSTAEWAIVGEGPAQYADRSGVAIINGTSRFTAGTTLVPFYESGYQTSQTSTAISYAGLRSFVFDHGAADIVNTAETGVVQLWTPGVWQISHQYLVQAISTGPMTLRFSALEGDETEFGYSNDVYLESTGGTQRFYGQESFNFGFNNASFTDIGYHTSGTGTSFSFTYNAIVTGDGTWYMHNDIQGSSLHNSENKITFKLLSDPDLYSFY